MLYDLLEASCRAFEEDGKAGNAAIEADGVVMSYRALHEPVAAHAAALTGLGISAADRIGLLLDRSIDCYCVMLAVVKLGAVHVPLDAKFPADRISYIAAIAARGQLRSGLCCRGALQSRQQIDGDRKWQSHEGNSVRIGSWDYRFVQRIDRMQSVSGMLTGQRAEPVHLLVLLTRNRKEVGVGAATLQSAPMCVFHRKSRISFNAPPNIVTPAPNRTMSFNRN